MAHGSPIRIWAFAYRGKVEAVLKVLAERTEENGRCDWLLIPLKVIDEESLRVQFSKPARP